MTDRERGAPPLVALLGPVLEAVRDLGGSARPQEVYDHLAAKLEAGPDVLTEQTPGGAPRFEKQIDWARHYLAKAGYLDSSQRGVWSLTERGLAGSLSREEASVLYRRVRSQAVRPSETEPATPDEVEGEHVEHVLRLLREMPPAGFERFCQRLLREAGFTDVKVTGQAGDDGIDGFGLLRVNSFVSMRVVFQCKRYRDAVGPSVVRDFRGAMAARAEKGIILTTGRFTTAAHAEALRDGAPPIELVDGEALIRILEDLEVGLQPTRAYVVDEEFFSSFVMKSE